MFADAVQVWVNLLLGYGQSLAGPNLVDDAGGLCATPWTATITLTIVLKLLGIVPYAKRLNGQEVVALCLGEALSGLMIDDFVDGLQALHGSPVAGKEVGMAGSGKSAVVHLDLLEGGIKKVEAEGRPGVNDQARGDCRLVLSEAGAKKADRPSHRARLVGPEGPSPIGRRRAGGWFHL